MEKSLKRLTDEEVRVYMERLKELEFEIEFQRTKMSELSKTMTLLNEQRIIGDSSSELEDSILKNNELWEQYNVTMANLQDEKKSLLISLKEFTQIRSNVIEAGGKERSEKQKNVFWIILGVLGLTVGGLLETQGCWTTQTFRKAQNFK